MSNASTKSKYRCDFCKKTLSTQKGITNHMNTIHKEQIQDAKAIEDIRVTSKSVHEVVDRLVAFWKDKGINVYIEDYPTSFDHRVSNSHNSPAGYPQNWGGKGDLPRGYPGWRGIWKGTVEVIDKKRWGSSLYFSDMVGSWGRYKGLPVVSWVKTGSGGGGDSFRYDGMLFLYDFPSMYDEYKINNEKYYQLVKDDYNFALQEYQRKYKQLRDEAVYTTPEVQSAKKLAELTKTLAQNAKGAEEKAIKYATNKFNKDMPANIPTPTSIFTESDYVKAIITDRDSTKIEPPELEAIKNRLRVLSEELKTFMETTPEMFV